MIKNMNGSNPNIEDEIDDLSERSGLWNKKEWLTLGKNCRQFFKFMGEILAEKPEAESYPIYLLPSILLLIIFCLTFSFSMYFSLPSVTPTSTKVMMTVLIPPIFLLGLMGGLWCATFLFQGSNNFQDLLIASAIFCTPLSVGLFLFWLLSYGTVLFAIPILFFSHSTSLIALYIALPKILLLKGFSRFATILLAIGLGVFAILVFMRIIL